MFKIALDAGHGMPTPGKRCYKQFDSKETREWYLNDRIADKVEKKLEAYEGYELIRVDDTTGAVDISLSQRVATANKYNVDFYLSVHHNAGVNGGAGGGIISIAHTNATKKSLEYQKIIYDALIKETGLKGNRSDGCPKQNLYVLRETNMPSVLIECGFMDSSTDVPVILSEEFADSAAVGIVNALVKIGNLTKKEEDNVDKKKFIDIENSYAKNDIEDLCAMGVINGVTEDRFMPTENITREAVAKIARNIIRYITGE